MGEAMRMKKGGEERERREGKIDKKDTQPQHLLGLSLSCVSLKTMRPLRR